jgi:hypothetical protein
MPSNDLQARATEPKRQWFATTHSTVVLTARQTGSPEAAA